MESYEFVKNNFDKLLSAYRNGIDNKATLLSNYDELKDERSRKLILYYLVAIILCKKKCVEHNITVLSGKSQKNNINSRGLPCPVYRGTWFDNLVDLRNGVTVVSPFSFIQRVIIICKAIILSRSISECFLGTWIDFYFLTTFLYESNVATVNARGHYDQTATWLGELSTIIGYKYYIYQHGVVSEQVCIPNKYPCNKVYVFDKHSESVFRNRIIRNEDCEYEEYSFSPSVEFSMIKKERDKLYIGLIEQCDSKWVDGINNTLKEFKNLIIYIMKHPLSNESYSLGDNIVVTDEKIFNLDLIISANSTLFLDYIWAGYKGKMMFTDKHSISVFTDYSAIEYVENDDYIRDYLRGSTRTY